MTAFIDTNVLIYAHGSGAKSEVARTVILAGGVITRSSAERVCRRPPLKVQAGLAGDL